MATGLARGAAARGKRIAFGDGHKILWDVHSAAIFAGNPNIAPPGQEAARDLEWVPFYKGNRIYNTQGNGRWIWNMAFRATPGEVFFTRHEQEFGKRHGAGLVVIEPNIQQWKSVASNKDWGWTKYQAVADRLRKKGATLVQFCYGGEPLLTGVGVVRTGTFREAVAVMHNAALYIGPEGGLHHAAAAVGIPAVVLFGGFVPPVVTGYATHINLTGGAEACGSLNPCPHCKAAMAAISVDEVLAPAEAALS